MKKIALVCIVGALAAVTVSGEAGARRCERRSLLVVINDENAPAGQYFAYRKSAKSPEKGAIQPAGLFKDWLAPTITIHWKGDLSPSGAVSNEQASTIRVELGELAATAPKGLTLQLKSGAFNQALPLDSWSLGGGSITALISDDVGPSINDSLLRLPRARFAALARQLINNPSTLTLRVEGRPFASVVMPPVGESRRDAQLSWFREAAPMFAQGRCRY